ncbi:MAG: hypothetical protein ACR2OH_06690 [Microthrixaceae bacterium]
MATKVQRGEGRRATPSRTRWLAAALVSLVALVAAACVTAGPGGAPSLDYVKNTEYGALAQAEAAQVAAGTFSPVIDFTVVDTPPSVFINYVVEDAQAAAFESFIGLPPGFSLAKVKILESDAEAHYWMSLNVYRVTGITTGLRAEWNTYVDDGSGTPQFMIVRARAADGSLDPIGPLAFPEPFQHSLDPDNVIRTSMNDTEVTETGATVLPDHLFSSEVALPDPVDRDFVTPTREWASANDLIYWMNGVADRTFYNSSAHSAPMISIDLADVTIDDDTEWTPYFDATPEHVLVYLDALEFVISPWWNVTYPDGLVDAGTLASLGQFKVDLYSGFANTQALGVQTGNAQPLVQSGTETAPESTQWHWRIPDANVAAMQASIGLPPALSLAEISLAEGEAPDNWLTLEVHDRTGTESGLRAEWSTHVDDGNGVHRLILDKFTDHVSLDPLNIFDDPTALSHGLAGSDLVTSIGAGAEAFDSTFELDAGAGTELASREFVGAQDLTYWRNGVIDRVWYQGEAFEPRLSINPATATVSDGGPWSAFVAPTPDRIWVQQVGAREVTNPWFNI